MDVVVSEAEMDVWALTDLLGRPMGSITKASERRFVIEPAGGAVETSAGMARSHASLDDALAEIETHTRGVCRRGWPQPGDAQ